MLTPKEFEEAWQRGLARSFNPKEWRWLKPTADDCDGYYHGCTCMRCVARDPKEARMAGTNELDHLRKATEDAIIEGQALSDRDYCDAGTLANARPRSTWLRSSAADWSNWRGKPW